MAKAVEGEPALVRIPAYLRTPFDVLIAGPAGRDRQDEAAQDPALVPAAVDAAFAAIERVDAAMSFHRSGSDVSRLNRAATGDRLALDPWTVEVLRLAAELHVATDGAFDCAIGAELIDMGLLPGERPLAGSGSVLDIEWLDALWVRPRRPVCIDLGGIAKGAAVDRAIEALEAGGIVQAVVNAGGDLRVLGPTPQPIHVRSPHDPARLEPIGSLADGAIATSSIAHTGGWHRGRWRSALVDARSRRPTVDRRSFSVLATRCAVADGLTKALASDGRLDPACLTRYGATTLVL